MEGLLSTGPTPTSFYLLTFAEKVSSILGGDLFAKSSQTVKRAPRGQGPYKVESVEAEAIFILTDGQDDDDHDVDDGEDDYDDDDIDDVAN